jgi:hypothetical protein
MSHIVLSQFAPNVEVVGLLLRAVNLHSHGPRLSNDNPSRQLLTHNPYIKDSFPPGEIPKLLERAGAFRADLRSGLWRPFT